MDRILVNAEVERLVEEHLPLVQRVVGWVTATGVPTHVPRADLTSAGMYGLFQAARGFDDDRGVPFGTYAATRVRGALLDELRNRDWAPRATRTAAREVDAAREALTAKLHRAPRSDELADELGLDEEELRSLLSDTSRIDLINLEAAYPDTGDAPLAGAEDDSPEVIVLERERDRYVRDAVAKLPDRLRKVVEDSYLAGCRLADIAEDLGVTESRVSQLRSQALDRLRVELVDLPS